MFNKHSILDMGKILSVKYYQNSGLIALTKVHYYLDKKEKKTLQWDLYLHAVLDGNFEWSSKKEKY